MSDSETVQTPGGEMPRRTVNLRTQVAMLLALATLPVGVLAVAQGLVAFRETQVLRLSAMARESVQISREERGAILEAFGAIVALDSQVDLDAPNARCNEAAESYVRTSELVSFTGVFLRDGSLHCGYPFHPTLNISKSPEFIRFMANPRRTVTAYAQGQISGVPVLVASAPLYRDEKLVGSLAISLPSHYLDWVGGRGPRDKDARFAILGKDGTQVAHGGVLSDGGWLPAEDELLALLKSESPRILRATNGQKRIFSATPLFKEDAFAVASWPLSRLTGAPSVVQFATLVLPIVMWLLAVIVAYYAVDRFALRHVLYLDRLVTAYGRTRRKLRAKGVRQAPQEFAQLGSSFDAMATEIESREQALRDSLEEKNVLLKEVYHRVKNNLQLIVSLINMQLRQAEHERERDGLMRLQARVHGLAAVHQKLYEADSLNAVRIDNLIREIATNARGAQGPEACDVRMEFDLIALEEPPERALPIALYSTEAIANAFKHSLEFGTDGELDISLRVEGENLVLLIVNTVRQRAPEAESDDEPRIGLGSKLIEGFARQLNGTIDREEADGRYSIRLTFPKTCPYSETRETG